MTIGSEGEATRRMVDLSLVLDVSSSIGGRWGAVRDAARTFVSSFDAVNDRVALVTYGNGAIVREQMRSSRGFDKAGLMADIPNTLPGGSTAMVEGLYRGWDEVRTVPAGQQSGLRVIVLFTDGASNSVPGDLRLRAGSRRAFGRSTSRRTFPIPTARRITIPTIQGLYDTETGVASPSYNITPANWNATTTHASVPLLPLTSWHSHRRSSGIPDVVPSSIGNA